MSDYNTVCLSLYDYHQLKDNAEHWHMRCAELENISILPELEGEISKLKAEIEDLKSKRWWQK